VEAAMLATGLVRDQSLFFAASLDCIIASGQVSHDKDVVFMASHSVRSAVVLVLLLGTLALAVPFVSSTIDAWLFADHTEPAAPKWSTQRPAPRTPKELQPANPKPISPGKQSSYDSSEEPHPPAPFAFDFQQDPEHPVRPEVVLSEHRDSPRSAGDLTELQQELQDLGAEYLTVERDDDRFECRALFPLSPQSSYQKAFSATGSSPQTAMEQVLAEVTAWKRATQRRK